MLKEFETLKLNIMKRPETNDKQYWDGDRFRHLIFIEHLEDYTNDLEQQLKNCNLQNVTHQRELLKAFYTYCSGFYLNAEHYADTRIDNFIKSL